MERTLKGGAIRYKTFTAMNAEDVLEYNATKAVKESLEVIYSAKGAFDETRVKRFIGTSEVKDRDGEILVIDGMDFKNFKKNPIVLFSHQSRELPVGKVVKVEKDVNKKIVYFDIYFAKANPFSETLLQLVDEEILKSTSLGFRVTDWEYDEKQQAFMLTKSEIFEISIVPVPANQDAVLQKEMEEMTTKDMSIDELATLVRQLTSTVTSLEAKMDTLEKPKAEEIPETTPEVTAPVEEETPGTKEVPVVETPVNVEIDIEALAKRVVELMNQQSDDKPTSEEDTKTVEETADPSPEVTETQPSNEDAEEHSTSEDESFESMSVEQLDDNTQFIIVNEEEN